MAASIKSIKIGIIAEEQNDIDVIYELTTKLINSNKFTFKKFVSHGCGKLRRKCSAWAQILKTSGCTFLIVVHDLDKNDEKKLRFTLERELTGVNFTNSIVLIPIEEMEAWLLSDPTAIKSVFNMKKLPKIPKHPENINSPKEFLSQLVKSNSKTQYLNTVHNKRIAEAVSISQLGACPSFTCFPPFLEQVALSHSSQTDS